jgi:mycothiol synthase
VAELSWHDELTPDQADAVFDLVEETTRADGVAPVGEQVKMRLHGDRRGSAHLLAVVDERLVGYAHLDLLGDSDGNSVAELAVRPADRGHGVGTALVNALTDRAEKLRIWSHGGHPAAERLAARLGLRNVRELLRMRLEFDGEELPEPQWPDGVRLRTFVPGQDEAAVVYVNHRAFDWHPEQGAMSVEDVRRREEEDWFDPKGFLLAVDSSNRLLGFHWTKVHEAGEIGEVYVVGVDPDSQGGGLGRALTLAGLRHLRNIGLRQVMLYVESDNAAAVRVYTRLGFEKWDSDVQYSA